MKKHFTFLSFIAISALILSFFLITQNDEIKNEKKPPVKKKSAGTKDNPFAAAQFRFEMLAGSNADVDLVLSRKNAVKYTAEMNPDRIGISKTEAITWLAAGPGNIGGRIRSIIINPSNTDHILIGSVAGGIWKTTNGGTTWSSKSDFQDPISIGSMVYTGSNVVYAGTGEGWGNIDAVYGGGIYKSTDFGDTWNLLTSTTGANIWNFRNTLRMAVDPSGNIYAATKSINSKGGVGSYFTNGGLFRSTDAGSSWTKISTVSITNYYNPSDIIPISSSIILLATNSAGIYRTTDSGTNWTLITSGLPSSGYRRIAMAQDPSTSSTIYAAYESTDIAPAGDAGLKGIYKSTDNGLTWSELIRPPNLASTGRSYLSAQGWYDNVIAVDPFNSDHIYAGGVDIVKSINGGTSWSQLTYWHIFYGTPVVHADQHVIAFDPNTSGVVYSGNDGGIHKSTNGGSSWSSLNNGLEITQFYSGAVYPTGTVYYGGTQDNGHLKYTSGTTWNEVEGGDGGYSAQHQSNSSIAYEEYVYLDMSKTTNGGTNWISCTSGLTDASSSSASLFIAPFSMNSEASNVLIAGSNKVWITSDDAGSWTQSSNILSSGNKVSAVTVVNISANYLGFAGTTDGKIFKCTSLNPASGIDTWTDITPSGNNSAWVRRIVVDINDKNKIYAAYSGYNNNGVSPSKHVYYSSDQGSSWTDISGSGGGALPDVPVHSIVIDPDNSQKLFIGTETGIFVTSDQGGSWSTFTTGMPSYVPVDELVLQTTTKRLFAFTHGRGAWVTDTSVPVELTSFTAVSDKNAVILNWNTASESNNLGFDIERSSSKEKIWKKIGFIPGKGNSNISIAYSFTDNSASFGKYIYRLKQLDNNGNFKYSKNVEVDKGEMPEEFVLHQNYPNPFNPSTKIRFGFKENGEALLKVYDALGEEVAELFKGSAEAGKIYEVEFNGSNFSSGVYYYKIDNGNFSEVKKMLLTK